MGLSLLLETDEQRGLDVQEIGDPLAVRLDAAGIFTADGEDADRLQLARLRRRLEVGTGQ